MPQEKGDGTVSPGFPWMGEKDEIAAKSPDGERGLGFEFSAAPATLHDIHFASENIPGPGGKQGGKDCTRRVWVQSL